MTHQHPTTFDTLAMSPELKQSIIADLDRFVKQRDYYRRIGKALKPAAVGDEQDARRT